MKQEKSILHSELIVVGFGAIIVLLFCLPYILLGEDAHVAILDNLDGVIANIKLLKDNIALFNSHTLLPMMSGLPRTSFGNEWNLTLLPFTFLTCYWAYVWDVIIAMLTAYLGMFLLLSKIANSKNVISIMLTSLAFSLTTTYAVTLGISVSGLPLLIYAFINLKEGQKIIFSLFVTIYYALGSFLVFSGVFVGLYLLCYGLFLIYNNGFYKTKYYWIGLIFLGAIYLVANYNLFESFFINAEYVSHRQDRLYSFSLIKKEALIVLYSQMHVGKFSAIYILLIYILSLIMHPTRKMWTLGILWCSVVALVLVTSLLTCVELNTQIFKEFDFRRFYVLYPTLCFVMLSVALTNFQISFKYYPKTAFWVSVVICLFFVKDALDWNPELKINCKQVFLGSKCETPSFRQFYDEELFNKISADLQISNRINEKVVSVGLYPAIAEYNGYYCLDGYMSDYPLSYKQKFRPIIEKELEKNMVLRHYFDDWGNRCYIFSSDCGKRYMFSKQEDKKIELDINVDKLLEMGCKYIFSAVQIKNYNSLQLRYIGAYTHEGSYWNLNVYQLQ